jgi:predicted amidohydrolase
MKSFQAALIQFQAGENVERNLAHLNELCRRAADHGAQLIIGPEMFYRFGASEKIVADAVSIPGPVIEELSVMARTLNAYFIPGTIAERVGDAVYNTLLAFDPNGEMIGKYRKRNLFQVNIPGKVTHDETKYFSPGAESSPVIETELGKIGFAICYDLRFPDHFLELASKGAEIIVMPSAFTKETGQAHWEILCRARAIENLSFMLCANQCGHTSPAPEIYGHSLAVDPWGRVLGEAGGGEEIVYAQLDVDVFEQSRERL